MKGSWIVRVQIERTESGVLIATSRDMPNLFVCDTNEESLGQEIRDVIVGLCAANGERVIALEIDNDQDQGAWVAVPAEIASNELRRVS